MVLSEKAKGKQRAVDPEPNGSLDSRDLTIRFTEGLPDLALNVTDTDTVRLVKAKIVLARPQLADRRLRLIHAGRILANGIRLRSWLSALEERQHCSSLSNEAPPSPVQTPTAVTWLHCSVGPKIEPETEAEDMPQTVQIQPLRGFDRLATAGFSEEDIANFRRQFHSQSSSNYLDLAFENDEQYDEHARALEELWIDSLDSGTNAPIVQSSSQMMVVKGIVLGFFFPIIPFFFLRDAKPAAFWDDGTQVDAMESVIFSRKTQVGIVFGFLVNLLFGTWRYLLDTS
ncbi:hypothetical protein SCLCIDRAFT_1222777 [Scleroderma citrinum Foug A]|uniref:Ubiquitin-like domain-containing protein n=1 Tax=Scleroderma citrinum Foug A TaxID=1036808 RepID=A0A0C2YUY5_9AGAM|nr:hypothetical protein SCLCIDRAFT_1222777 [Scleroderma citrinum Foug A]